MQIAHLKSITQHIWYHCRVTKKQHSDTLGGIKSNVLYTTAEHKVILWLIILVNKLKFFNILWVFTGVQRPNFISNLFRSTK